MSIQTPYSPTQLLEPAKKLNLCTTSLRSDLSKKKYQIIRTGHKNFAVSENEWLLHKELVQNINRRLEYQSAHISTSVIYEAVKAATFPLIPEQINAVIKSVENSLCIVTGAPGSGKSAIMQVVTAIYKSIEPTKKVAILAFSATIAATTANKCKGEPYTINSFTGLKPGEEYVASRKKEPPQNISAVLVDEAFSADPTHLAALFKIVPPNIPVILFGDPNQILPIGEGRFLHDLLTAQITPRAYLSQNHRLATRKHLQKQIENLKCGIAPTQGPGLRIITTQKGTTKEKAEMKIRTALSIKKQNDARLQSGVIITQTKIGPCGSYNINMAITRRTYFQKGDPVITTDRWPENIKQWKESSNRWLNGYRGVVTDANNEEIEVSFENGTQVVCPQDITSLTFAHAMTGAKAQGTEYDTSTVILDPVGAHMIDRRYLISVLSRSPNCTLLTEPTLLHAAAQRDIIDERPNILDHIH